MNKNNMFWQCEYESADSKREWKMLQAMSSVRALKRAYETGIRIGMSPKYETLRQASPKEISEFKKMIKNRISKNE